MTTKEIRELAARRSLEVGLIRAHPDLTDGALAYLVDAGTKTIEWREAVDAGTDFDVQGCVTACRASEVGQLIFADQNEDPGTVDHVAATADMDARSKLNYARDHGLL